MPSAIQFDLQLAFPAAEIHDKGQDGELPDEFVTTDSAIAQDLLQFLFCLSGLAAHRSGKRNHIIFLHESCSR
jgi:hypothetical protein